MRAERLTLALLLALQLAGCGWNPWAKPTFKALITDATGTPLPGAVASSDGRAAIADAEGRVELADAGSRVWVQKTGYAPLEVDVRTDAVSLNKRDRPISIVWDERFSAPVKMEGLKSHLVGHGMEIRTLHQGELPQGAEVLVLACPSWFTEDAYKQYMRAAHAGSKLVLLGEWGGFDGVDLAALTAIASQAGITFESGQVRVYGSDGQPQSWLKLDRVSPAPLASGISSGVTVFTAGVLSVEAPAQVILASRPEAIRILRWEVGTQTVAAMGPLGRSQVVAIADASLFSDDAGPDGTAQWKSADNVRFAENVMAW